MKAEIVYNTKEEPRLLLTIEDFKEIALIGPKPALRLVRISEEMGTLKDFSYEFSHDPRKECTLMTEYCIVHDLPHGAEASELRKGIEDIIKTYTEGKDFEGDVVFQTMELQRLINKVDDQDSYAYEELVKKRKEPVE